VLAVKNIFAVISTDQEKSFELTSIPCFISLFLSKYFKKNNETVQKIG